MSILVIGPSFNISMLHITNSDQDARQDSGIKANPAVNVTAGLFRNSEIMSIALSKDFLDNRI